MSLSEQKEDQLRNMPLMESRVFKSKDGKYVVHKTIVTDIKPTAYYTAVLENAPSEESATQEPVEA